DYQQHIYNQSHAAIPAFIERIRSLIDNYGDRFTVAEVGGANALKEMKAFTEGENHLNSAYSFDYLYAEQITPELVRKTMNDWPGAKNEGWPSWAFSNHDAPRAESRWAKSRNHQEFSKFALLLLMSLRGNVFLYQGEELGLPQADIPFDKLQDPEAIANWPDTLGRDGARTPLPWKQNAVNGGFSEIEPWLPVDERHIARAIDQQNNDAHSVLNFTRKLIAFRNASQALRLGDITFLDTPEHVLAFTRSCDGETVLCVFNFSENEVNWTPPNATETSIGISANIEAKDGLPATLPAESGYIATI
ncbi:MAG: alpha-glucosidase C-terminal domain-containing protein, partial [Sphingomonadales bacterium]|nr:alpha-glucosidase C-terminal domain-containing protein [Sphingomonadales bacterium]